MTTIYKPIELARILEVIFPSGGWAAQGNEITIIPAGATMPTAEDLAAAHTVATAKRAEATQQQNAKETKKSALFLELKTRLATDLEITVVSPADLAGRIEDVIPAARAKRNGKASTAERLAGMEKQVELLTMFVALLSRQ